MKFVKPGGNFRTLNKRIYMRKFPIFFFVVFLFAGCFPFFRQTPILTPQTNPEITDREISEHIKFLADDALRGRYPGTPGSDKAIDYIIRQWSADGVLPAGTDGYKQYFDFTNRIGLGENNSLTINGRDFTVGEDFIPLSFSADGDLTAEAVFVGYGFAIADSLQWDDYAGLDVTGKWVVIIRGGPDNDTPHSPFDSHTPLRKKVLVARDHKAGGVLFVSQPSDNDSLIALKFDYDFSGAGIPVLHLSQKTAEFLFKTAGKDFSTVFTALNKNQAPQSFSLGETTVSASVDLVKNTVPVPNLIGLIPGNDPAFKDEYIVIGAHFDHLGLGGPGTNSTQPDTIAVHNGADDNASGVAGVLEIGQKLAAHRDRLKRSVLLACFNAEEEGLLGSKFFVNNPTINPEDISVM
ncbi:MAG: M28 family peptidase, partial [FCB group bacterium]|nr:M28 family peptidase [FCB group bacterium]